MSKMRSDRKPPLAAISPMRLRPRRILPSSSNTVQSPPGFLAKTHSPSHPCEIKESVLRPEYHTISCELRALAKMVQEDFGNVGFGNTSSAISSPLFERGRFYDEYSARRNERLKRKKGETGVEKKTVYDLGVKVESAKRGDSKRFGGLRKTVPSTPVMTGRTENPRYLLRSMSNKPSLPVNFEKSVAEGDRKTVAGKGRKI